MEHPGSDLSREAWPRQGEEHYKFSRPHRGSLGPCGPSPQPDTHCLLPGSMAPDPCGHEGGQSPGQREPRAAAPGGWLTRWCTHSGARSLSLLSFLPLPREQGASVARKEMFYRGAVTPPEPVFQRSRILRRGCAECWKDMGEPVHKPDLERCPEGGQRVG